MPAPPNDLYSISNLGQVLSFYASLNLLPFVGLANRSSDMISLLILQSGAGVPRRCEISHISLALALSRLLSNIWTLMANDAAAYDAESVPQFLY